MNLKRAIVYVSKAEKEKESTVRESVSNVLAAYPNFLLVEVDTDQINSIKNQGLRLEVQDRTQMIRLRTVEFDTSEEPPSPPQVFTLSAADIKGKRNYWIVQFIGPIKSEWRGKIRKLGGKLQNFIPENAFLVEMTSEAKKRIEELPFVEWVGLYEPVYKVSPLLMGRKKRAAPSELSTLSISTEAFSPLPEGNIYVMVHNPADLKKVSEVIEELGGTIVTTGKDVIRASLDLSQIDKLAKMVEVKWIEPYVMPELFNDVAAEIMEVQPVWETFGLDGEGQIVAVADTGLDTGKNDGTMHEDFKGRIVSIYSWEIPAEFGPYLDNTVWDDGPADRGSGHGTHVTGSVLGNGARSGGTVRGMAFKAQVVFQAVEQWADWKKWVEERFDREDGYYLLGIPDDFSELFQQAYNDGARIHTNSWGSIMDKNGESVEGGYEIESKRIDEFMWNHKDFVILFAVGNLGQDKNPQDGVVDERSLSIQACAKNCISVGASESERSTGGYQGTYDGFNDYDENIRFPENPIKDDHISNNPEGMAAFSGRGPTDDDDRIKPDVVAPGTNIHSVRSSLLHPHQHYMYMSGTSMATPLTAGTVALIRQYLTRDCHHENPSAALLKAILVHGATPLAGQYTPPEVGPVPDISQGWGRVNLKNSLFPEGPVKWDFRDDPADTLETGECKDFTFETVNDTVPFKATLVWTDYPGDPSNRSALVNKLLLSLISPDGATVDGNPENNVQQVVIENPKTGEYTVRIWAKEVNEGGKQDFAFVVSGGISPPIDVYIRDNVNDTGTPHTGPINNSPDIILCPEKVDNPQKAYGEGSGTENDCALGYEAVFGQNNYIYVRVRNRGRLPAYDVKATVYWSTPATLVTPDSWKLVNTEPKPIPRVPGGNVLTVSGPITWEAKDIPDEGHYCFVGLIGNEEDPAPYVDASDWNFENFIRDYNNITWKNFNVIEYKFDPQEYPQYMELPFLTPGALDRTRQMQLEIVANLPKGARIWFEMRPNIIDGRHFRDRGVDRRRDRAVLEVSPQGSTKFKARFPAKSKTKAKLRIYVPEEYRNNEYEVFVRQLYRRKEIGRVTWRLVPQGQFKRP